MNERLVLKNRLPEVQAFQRHLEDMLQQQGFSADLVHDLSLVCEEVLVNIVHYGYPEPEGAQREAEILVHLSVDLARKIRIEIRDDAVAFNPLLVDDRDPDDDRVGGWGIPMLRSLTDQVEYHRDGHENVLTMERSERDS
jgi:anti-sigma regulatory factor (Ser/Thr protein kinase)